jgi:hypothetical protein
MARNWDAVTIWSAETRIALMHQQIVVTGHQVIGFADERRGEDVLIFGIAQ